MNPPLPLIPAPLLALFLWVGLGGSSSIGLHAPQPQETLNRQLIAAVDHNDTEAVRTLLRQGANPNTLALPEDDRPLVLRLLEAQTVLAKAIEWFPPPNEMQWYSPRSRLDNVAMITLLLDAGADLNKGIIEVHNGSNPATPEFAYRLGTTPFVEAAYKGKWLSVRALMAHHADVNASDQFGETALMYAVNQMNVDMVKALVKAGARVNATDGRGETALFWAFDIWRDVFGPLKDLTDDAAAFPSAPSPAGPQPTIVRFLLSSGAKVHLKNWEGKTLMAVAQDDGDKQLIQLLKQAEAARPKGR